MRYIKKYFQFLAISGICLPMTNIQTMSFGGTHKLAIPALATGAASVLNGNHLNHVVSAEGPEKSGEAQTMEELEKLNKMLDRIPSDKILDNLINNEKMSLLRALIRRMQPKATDENGDGEDALFRLRKPQPLMSGAPLQKTTAAVLERISTKYIGDIPNQIKDMVAYYSNYDLHKAYGTNIYNRILLYGSPGIGKSWLAQVVAEELQIPHISVSASIFADKYIGESSRKIRKLFDIAKSVNGPVIIFIDEIDAIATQRTGYTHEEHRGALITLLTELQDIQKNNDMYVIAATNVDPANTLETQKDSSDRKPILDPAVKDRFAGSIAEIKKLDENGRAKLLMKFFKDYNIDTRSRDAIMGLSNESKQKDLYNSEFAQRLSTVLGNDKFSNREIQYVVISAQLKKVNASLIDPEDKHHFAYYVRKAIESTGKKASYAWTRGVYSDGI